MKEIKMPEIFFMQKAKEDITKAVAQVMKNYGIPASIMEGILEGCLASIRASKCNEINSALIEVINAINAENGKEENKDCTPTERQS